MTLVAKYYSRRIPVRLEKNPYEIVIQAGGLKSICKELFHIGIAKGTKILVVTNPDVASPYGQVLINELKEGGFKASFLVLEAGEAQKTPKTISLIHDAAYNAKLERGSVMIALGGGVVGDMTGFAAATWLRGISVVQVPTTLLAMVDASIGGKTGVNHPKGKNLIGAFHQPKLVLIDPETLQTLPKREFRAGMAEVIKYGIIGDPKLFKILEDAETIDDLASMNSVLLQKILEHSADAKAKIVAQDEVESGIRAILNYGHTFGHVVENLCGYGKWLHGEAVAIGMVAAGELAVLTGDWTLKEANIQQKLIKKAGLPTNWPLLNSDEVIRSLQGDKKVKKGLVRFVIPIKIGKVKISENIKEEHILKCISNLNRGLI